MRRIFALFLIVLTLAACEGSKHFTKMGQKQEEAGLITEAANSYYIALLKKRTNLDAQIGMKKTGQTVLNNLLAEFGRNKSFGTPKEAVYSFHAALYYRDKIKGVGVDLQIPDFYLTDYNASKEVFLGQLYDQSTTLMEEGKFKEAEPLLAELRVIDPSYKDSHDLADIAYLEPLYIAGSNEFQAQHYRAAYENFEKVIARKSTYKDASALSKQCIEKGRYTIALLSFENATQTPGLDAKVSAYTLEALTNIKDPFLRVVDREHIAVILQEQKLQLSGVVDDATAVQVGQLAGANAILTGTVLSYTSRQGTLRTKNREAYQAYQVKKLNAQDGKYYNDTQYRKTNYTEYYNSSACDVSFQYKLINIQTGELIKTELITQSNQDEVLFGRFDGDHSSLYPATQAGVNFNTQDRRSLLSLFNARETLKSSTELSNDLFNNICSQMSNEIGIQVKNLVK